MYGLRHLHDCLSVGALQPRTSSRNFWDGPRLSLWLTLCRVQRNAKRVLMQARLSRAPPKLTSCNCGTEVLLRNSFIKERHRLTFLQFHDSPAIAVCAMAWSRKETPISGRIRRRSSHSKQRLWYLLVINSAFGSYSERIRVSTHIVVGSLSDLSVTPSAVESLGKWHWDLTYTQALKFSQ